MKSVAAIIILVLWFSILTSTTRTVKLDGTGDYSAIQSAIDCCSNGDTIIVYPGRYLENLNLNHKQQITLASLEFTTGNAAYIGQTIIDGHEVESCIKIEYGEQNILIQGFSITNGAAQMLSIPTCSFGGGVLIQNQSRVSVVNCAIFNNTATAGGGIEDDNAFLNLSNVSIRDNRSEVGGGIFCYRSRIVFDSTNLCSVYNNSSGTGMDIWLSDLNNHTDIVLDTVTVNPPNRFYIGCQNQIFENTTATITASYGIRQEVNHDIYVSPDGNDQNSGLTSAEPFRTISWAMQVVASDSLNPKKVVLAPGIYSDNLNQQIYPIPIKSNVSLIGESEENTIIKNGIYSHTFAGSFVKKSNISNVTLKTNMQLIPGYISLLLSNNITINNLVADSCSTNSHSFFYGESLNDLKFENVQVKSAYGFGINCMYIGEANLTIRNSSFDHIISNYDDSGAQGVFVFSVIDSVIIENTMFTNCESHNQGSSIFNVVGFNDNLSNFHPQVKIKNCLFANNLSDYNPTISSMTYADMDMQIDNCTFVNNVANNLMPTIVLENNTTIKNSIFDNTTYHEISFVDNHGNGENYLYGLDHNDIVGGLSATHEYYGTGHVTWHESNIDVNPYIIGGDMSNPLNYRLNFNSPCINAGTPDTTGLFLPSYDLNGAPRIFGGRIDMGCYEWDGTARNDPIVPPIERPAVAIYPNPFNAVVQIDYAISKAENVEICIYNIRGQHVKTLFSGKVKSGLNSYQWNGTDETECKIAAGVYLCRIHSSGMEMTKKVIFIK